MQCSQISGMTVNKSPGVQIIDIGDQQYLVNCTVAIKSHMNDILHICSWYFCKLLQICFKELLLCNLHFVQYCHCVAVT